MTDKTRDGFEALEQIRDELRVRAHLAGMDAKKAWDDAHFERVGDTLDVVGHEVRLSLHLASLEAREAWNRVEKRLSAWKSRSGGTVEDAARELSGALTDVLRAFRGAGDDDVTEPRGPASPGGAPPPEGAASPRRRAPT